MGVAASAPTAVSADAGQVMGRIMDQTPPARPLAGQSVTLAIVERGSTSERQTTTDAAGRFAFGGLAPGGVRVFLVRTQYGGVPYEARAALTPEAPVAAVDLSVYEPTQDRAVIRGTLALAVVETSRGAVRISVIQRLENPTDRAVVATDRDPLVFPLPRDAEAVEFVGGWRDPHVTNGAITDAIPVLPGAMAVGYAFGLDAAAARRALSWTFPYGATDVEVLVADPAVRARGPSLRAAGTVTEAKRSFARWSGGPVPPGGQLAVTLDGLPPVDNRWPGTAAGVLAVLLAAGLAVALRRRPTASA